MTGRTWFLIWVWFLFVIFSLWASSALYLNAYTEAAILAVAAALVAVLGLYFNHLMSTDEDRQDTAEPE